MAPVVSARPRACERTFLAGRKVRELEAPANPSMHDLPIKSECSRLSRELPFLELGRRLGQVGRPPSIILDIDFVLQFRAGG